MNGPRITPNYIFNRIVMARLANKTRTFVMVEGPTDEKFWVDFIPDKFCKLQRVCGKPDVIRLLEANLLRRLPGFAGLVDADYWLIAQSDELLRKNLLYDDSVPDAELMLLDSPILADVLMDTFDQCDRRHMIRFAGNLQNEAERLAMEFGYFRLLNHLERYGISFKNFWRKYRHDDFFDKYSLEFWREKFSIELKEFCPRISGIDLLMEVDELKNEYKTGGIQLCQGHEVVAIISCLLPKMYQSEFGRELTAKQKKECYRFNLEEKLRETYTEKQQGRHFVETSLYSCIRNWENKNTPYKILKPQI